MGGTDGKNQIDSIERLDVQGGAEAWEILSLPGFTGREEMLVSTLNTNQILIAGGFNGTDLLSDVYILEDGET